MAAKIEILTGVAGSGKTDLLLREYRASIKDAQNQQTLGTNLWISPTFNSTSTVLSLLLDETLPICFAPNIMTFDRFAERLLAEAEPTIRRMSPVMQRTLLRRIVHSLQSEKRLAYFSKIAGTSGFLDLVTGLINELKRDEIWPEEFEAACRRRGSSDKDRDLVLVYREYQAQLIESQHYDAEGAFWSAREALKNGLRGPFQELSLIVVDGFTDFTETQYEILAHLSEFASRICISLPLDPGNDRTDLFSKTQSAQNRLREIFGRAGCSVRVQDMTRVEGECPAAINQISDFLFTNPRETPASTDADGIEILAATGQLGELEAIAVRIKCLMEQSVPPDEIVVAFRSLDEYSELVRETFGSARIPFNCDSQRPLSHLPNVKALLAVLQMELDDWPVTGLLAIISSSYFRPKWPELEDDAPIRALTRMLRGQKLDAGRHDVLSAVRWQSQQAQKWLESPDEYPKKTAAMAQETIAACNIVEQLDTALECIRHPTDPSSWVDRLLSLGRELGFECRDQQSDDTTEAFILRDQQLWTTVEGMLHSAIQFVDRLAQTSAEIDLAGFIGDLKDLLQSQRVPRESTVDGVVRVLEAHQVRNLEVPYLFVAGLSEASFPRMSGDDCLYNEADRLELNANGLTLRDRSSMSHDEMLLFYGIVTRARRQLTLSYPAVNRAGQPLFSSPYLTSIRDLFSPDALAVQHVGQLDPVPSVDAIISDADLRICATADLQQGRAGLFRAMMQISELQGAARGILAAALLANARFHTRGFTQYEGRLELVRNLRFLGELFSTKREFSATQLESYAECPFRFLLSHVLKIELGDATELATDHRRRGILVHDILAELHDQDLDQQNVAQSATAEFLTSKLRELISERFESVSAPSKAQAALNRIESEILNELAEAYGMQWSEYVSRLGGSWEKPPEPLSLEMPFGSESLAGQGQSTGGFEGITFGNGQKAVTVQGRIDRIDVGNMESQRVFNIIDYKTGRPSRFDLGDVSQGRALQLAIYLIAAWKLGMAGEEAVPHETGYWAIREEGFFAALGREKRNRKKKVADPWDESTLGELESILHEVVPTLVSQIRDGQFPVYNEDEDCTGRCAYHTVCRVRQIRPLEDALDKKHSL